MTGEVQTATNPIVQARFIRKSDAKELDRIREDYVSLMDEVRELEEKGKTEKAEEKRKIAEGAMILYQQRAQELGLSVTSVQEAASAVDRYNGKPLVEPGTRLTKAQKKEVEKAEKELKKYQKKLSKFSEEEIKKANLANTAGSNTLLTDDMKDILYCQQKLSKAQTAYEALRIEYGIPSANDIIKRVYAVEDPTKASKIKDIVKKELKDANMYFGLTKDALNDDALENVMDVLAIRNEINSNIERGYVGTKKKLVERYEGKDAAEVASELAQAAGADLTFNRRSNERRIAQLSQNVEYYNDTFIDENKDKALTELETIVVAGKELKTADIERITTLAGGVLTARDGFGELKLGDIRTIEVGGKQYDLTPIYKERGDENYNKRKDVKRLGKDIGFEYDKIKWGKAVVDAATVGIPAAAAMALDGLKILLNPKERFAFHIDGEGSISSSVFDKMFEDIKSQLENQELTDGSTINIGNNGEVIDFEYLHEFYFKKNHLCVAPVIASAAAAFVASIVEQVMQREEISPEKAYHAARAKLNLEMMHNAAGGDGYIINQKELDKAMLDVIAAVNELLDTPAPVETVTPPVEKVAEITTTNVDPVVTQAEDCLYNNKPGEHWDGIVRLGYVDANGKAISNEADIAELRNFTKRKLNGFDAASADMPNGVKIRNKYTCKSGNTYTWSLCGEEPDAAARDKYTSKEAAKDANGNLISSSRVAPKVGMESTQSTVTPGQYGWNWQDKNDVYGFGGQSYDNPTDRDAAMQAEKEALEEAGYTVIQK